MVQEFEEIFDRYYAQIYKYVMSLCCDAALAEEVTQDTFFKALKGIDSFKGNCSILSWLCAIAKNCLYSHHRKYKRQGSFIADPAGDDVDVEAQFLQKEAGQEIHRVLHRLPEPYREVFWLKCFGELSYREIGDLFGKSESWGRVTYYRAKMKIREELE